MLVIDGVEISEFHSVRDTFHAGEYCVFIEAGVSLPANATRGWVATPRTDTVRLYPMSLFPEIQEEMMMRMHDHDGFTTEDYEDMRNTDYASRVGVNRRSDAARPKSALKESDMDTKVKTDIAKLRIDGERLWASLMELAQIGATPKGGVCRLTLTDLDKQGRDLVSQWAREAGMTITIDKIGNGFLRRPGRNNACRRS